MRALVTGGAGFVGRHMARELLARGYDVVTIDVRPTLVEYGYRHLHVIGDALDHFRKSSTRFDLVVHAAAAEPHRAAIDGHPMNMATNLMLDAAMFDWAVRTGQGRVLYLSSSAAYPIDLQDDWTQENFLEESDIAVERRRNIGRPDAAYGWTKLTGEQMAAAANAAGVPVHVVRPFSGYGEDQGPNWPFGAFRARAVAREDPFVVWGTGEQVRDWIHISDVVNGALAVVDADERRPVNLCTGAGTSMLELIGLFCKAVGYSPEIKPLEGKPSGVLHRVGNPALFNRYYTAQVSIEDGVERAVAWTSR